jgi:predicted acyltransferase
MTSPTPQRALALDALRGLSIFLMILSSSIPFGVLPSWMYHAQVPPPEHTFIPTIPGITWVDLVFPFFLFSMGAAIPIALSRRIERGDSTWKITGGLLLRGLLLAAFAIYDEHIRPWRISKEPTAEIWLLALLGFALLIPMFVRLPRDWNRWLRYSVKGGAWAGAIILLALLKYPDGSGFSLYRSDIIILVLANMAVFAGLIWLATREQLLLRLGVLGILIALRVSSVPEGWVHDLWQSSPVPWLFRFDFLKYLFIVVPGTIIGDMLLKWMKGAATGEESSASWNRPRLLVIGALMLMFNILLLVGLKGRFLLETTVLALLLCGCGWFLFRRPGREIEKLLQRLYRWGIYLMVLGLYFELSYYFATGGLAVFTLIGLMILIDLFKTQRWWRTLIESGQNPLIAYAGINNLIRPLLALTGLGALLETLLPTPWLGVLRGIIITYLVALSAAIFTRLKIFLRT